MCAQQVLIGCGLRGRLLRRFSAAAAPPSAPAAHEEARVHGGLRDEDRIFTNLYCQGDPFLKVLTAAALRSCLVVTSVFCCSPLLL